MTYKGAAVATGVVVLAILVLTVHEWSGWHVGLFLWGVGLGILGAIYAFGMGELLMRMRRDAVQAFPEWRSQILSLRRKNALMMLAFGLVVAFWAGGTGSVSVVAGYTAILVVVGSLSTVVGVRTIRRSRSR